SVMGGEQAAGVLNIVREQAAAAKAKKTGVPVDKEKLAMENVETKARLTAQFEKQSDAFYSSARLWDDGVIHPVETRSALILGLLAAASRPLSRTRQPVYRM
ncbi:MAG TPA: carboxyl transferase domain-containing protein, partial [Turneriella sp.]|nr:carboxyl transferase domain-containing protein [Turneriella sp.]